MAEAARDKTTEFNKQTEPLRIEQAKKVTSKFFFIFAKNGIFIREPIKQQFEALTDSKHT
jgi:hypothetical protein